jgi:hypothetical protein
MGELRKRGSVWWLRYYRNGRRFEESAWTDKCEVARDLLRTREGDIAKGVPVSAKIGRLRYEDAAADLQTDYKINAKKSIAHVKRHVKQLTKYFGGRRMAGSRIFGLPINLPASTAKVNIRRSAASSRLIVAFAAPASCRFSM